MVILNIPAKDLKRYVNPLDGQMWRCKPINESEIRAAVRSGVRENRRWHDLINTLNEEEARIFHINRVATLVEDIAEDAIILILENHTETIRAYLNDGNHRLAASYVRGDGFVKAIVAASDPESILRVFPDATSVER